MSENNVDSTGMRGSGMVGSKLKESGTDHWSSPNAGSTNASGFTALSGGITNPRGGFALLGNGAIFWSSSEYASKAWTRGLYYSMEGMIRGSSSLKLGHSVRCLKD